MKCEPRWFSSPNQRKPDSKWQKKQQPCTLNVNAFITVSIDLHGTLLQSNRHQWRKSHVTVWAPPVQSLSRTLSTDDKSLRYPCTLSHAPIPFHQETSGCSSRTNHCLSQGFDHAPEKWACVYATCPFHPPVIFVFYPPIHLSSCLLTPLPLSHYPIMGEVVIYPSLHSPEVLYIYMFVCVCECSSSPLAIVTTTCVSNVCGCL